MNATEKTVLETVTEWYENGTWQDGVHYMTIKKGQKPALILPGAEDVARLAGVKRVEILSDTHTVIGDYVMAILRIRVTCEDGTESDGMGIGQFHVNDLKMKTTPNTAWQMAYKRAFIAAVRKLPAAFGLSAMFTEEYDPEPTKGGAQQRPSIQSIAQSKKNEGSARIVSIQMHYDDKGQGYAKMTDEEGLDIYFTTQKDIASIIIGDDVSAALATHGNATIKLPQPFRVKYIERKNANGEVRREVVGIG